MDSFDISEDFTINLMYIKGIERTSGDRTKIYIELDESTNSVISNIPYDTFRGVVKERKNKDATKLASSQKIEKYLDQLSKFQTRTTP